MAEYLYYVVDSSFILRVWSTNVFRAERLNRDGTWANYPYPEDAVYNGRQIPFEEVDVTAKELWSLNPI